MKNSTWTARRIVETLCTLALFLFLPTTGILLAQEPTLPDSTYDAFYPKRAKGYQPTAWEVTKVDDVNLYNGNVMLHIPLGPPLEPGGDLSWQPTLYYNSKIWANDKRDAVHDDWSNTACWKDEGRGFVMGDPWVGLGWVLNVPHVFVERYETPNCHPEWQCYELVVKAVMTEDGARHALAPCELSSAQCSGDSGPTTWYSTDGSGWRVTWNDDDNDSQLSGGDSFVGQAGGYRYTFGNAFLMTLNDPGSVGLPTAANYRSEARGYYLTRIESERWPGPALTVEYFASLHDQNVLTRAPRVIRAIDSQQTVVRSVELIRCSDADAPPSLCPSAPDRCIDCDPPPGGGHGSAFPSAGEVDGVITWAGEPGSAPLVAYTLTKGNLTEDTALQILQAPQFEGNPCDHDCFWGNHCSDSNWTGPVPYFGARVLAAIELLRPDGNGSWESLPNGPVTWQFGYEPGLGRSCPACGNPPSDPISPTEKQGVLRQVTLPNGAEIHYDYADWTFAYQDPLKLLTETGDPCYILALNDLGEGGNRPLPDQWTPCMEVSLLADRTVGISDRKVVKGNDLLEWTEYLSDIGGAEGGNEHALFYLRRDKHPGGGDAARAVVDFDGLNVQGIDSDPILARLYTGIQVRVQRRHLVIGNNAGEPLDPVPPGYTSTLPPSGDHTSSHRYDDTLYVFSNGRVIYDENNNDQVEITDSRGRLPLDGRLLEVRHYRGSAETPSDDFQWYLDTAPKPLEVDGYTYTLQLEPDNGDPNILKHQNTFRFCLGNEGEDARCYAWSGNVRKRRSVKAFLHGDIDDSQTGDTFDRFWAEEYFYEPDDGNPGGVAQSDPKYAMNRVATVTMEGYADESHYPPVATVSASSTSWPGLGADKWGDAIGYRTKQTTYDKAHEAQWLTALVASSVTKTSSPAGATQQFVRTTYAYGTTGRLQSERRHVALNGDSNGDVIKSLTYHVDTSHPGSFGRVKTVALRTAGAAGDDLKTGYLYDRQQVTEKWVLCDPQNQSCDGWPAAPSELGGSPGELQAQVSIDPYWRRPVSVTDGNGDGISNITYDAQGRVTRIDPTSSSRSKTWIDYPDLSTSEVSVLGRTGGDDLQQQVVARYEFDGLGRIAHAARRKEGSTGSSYDAAAFRHKGFFYDGVGAVWAESHWLDSFTGATTPPASTNGYDPSFEITKDVDPLGRVVATRASDGGSVTNIYWGVEWSESASPRNSSDTRRIYSRKDATGKLRDVWERKKGDPWGGWSPETAGSNWDYFNDTAHYVHSGYDYDVRGNLWRTRVGDRYNNGPEQFRVTVYDALGHALSETIPERDGAVTYHDFTASGAPREVDLPLLGCGGSPVAMHHSYDAAAREIAVDAGICGTPIPLRRLSYGVSEPAKGKIVTATQYNFAKETCGVADYGNGMDEPVDSIKVETDYTYGGEQGELSSKEVTVRDLRYGGTATTFEMAYGYDSWGNISSLAYPCVTDAGGQCRSDLLAAPAVTAIWNAMGLERIDAKVAGQGTSRALVDNVVYDPSTGMMVSWKTPTGGPNSGFSVLHEVQPDGTRPRPVRMTLTDKPWNHLVYDMSYSYDLLGNIVFEADGAAVTSYGYDLLSRLINVSNPDGSTRAYTYDDFGNLTSVTTTGSTQGTGGPAANTVQTLPVDPATNRLVKPGEEGYLYDAMGNLLRRWADGKAQWVRRDPEGRIVAAWTEGVPERYRFVYDHTGERVAAFREESLHVLDETFTLRDEGGNVLADLQWANGGGWSRLADRIYLGRDEQVRMDYAGGGNWTFTTTGRDHLGTARAEVYGSNMWRRLDLWPYGEIRTQTPHNTSKTLTNGVHLFTGHERDFAGTTTNPRKGLDYMHARYYTFNLGRFMSVDPVPGEVGSSQSWNRYAYVLGNPIRRLDPDGRAGLDGGLVQYEFDTTTGQRVKKAGQIDGAQAFHAATDWTDPFQVGSATAEAIAGREGMGKIALAVAKDAVRTASAVGLVKGALSLARGVRALIEGGEEGVSAAKSSEAISKGVKERLTPSQDGATSRHIIETADGETVSITHQVEKNGAVIHQHQTHIGKHGTRRVFPDDWVENPTIPPQER